MLDKKPLGTKRYERRLRRTAGAYLRKRWSDIWGDPRSGPRGRPILTRLLDETLGSRVSEPPTLPRDSRPLAVSRADRPAAGSRSRYSADAAFARAFLSGAAAGVLICAHRVWLTDWAGALASLGMAFTLAAFALVPAHRCWQIRTRTSGRGREFLRRPTRWWPQPLPPRDPP